MPKKEQDIKILFYDCETTLLWLWAFSLGKQVIRHNQLISGMFNRFFIICISYRWAHEDKVHTLHWGRKGENPAKVIEDFDKIIRQADITIGKNSDNFDVKHINTQRLLAGLEPLPEWVSTTDDIEKQVKRFFGKGLPSRSLDYISSQLKLGGKNSMEFSDWTWINSLKFAETLNGKLKKVLKVNKLANICTSLCTSLLFGEKYSTIKSEGNARYTKMITYCAKDVNDTVAIWNKIKSHIKPRWNVAAMKGKRKGCVDCGSTDLVSHSKRLTLNGALQVYYCKECQHYKTVAPISRVTGNAGVTKR